MQIAGRNIGPDHEPYWIADLSANHLGSLDRALAIMDAAKWAGADAIKPQLFTPEEMCKPGTIAPDGPWKGKDLFELYQEIQTPRSWFPRLFEHGREIGLTVFSSVFSLEGVDYLESLGCPAYKIAANEYNWSPLIERCRDTGKPVLVSVPSLKGPCAGIPLYNRPGYPLAFEEANMGEMGKRAHKYSAGPANVFGFSSHVMEPIAFPMAVALGASILEVHLTTTLEGWDQTFSWLPTEFKEVIAATHAAWQAMRPREITLPGYRRNLETGLRECAA